MHDHERDGGIDRHFAGKVSPEQIFQKRPVGGAHDHDSGAVIPGIPGQPVEHIRMGNLRKFQFYASFFGRRPDRDFMAFVSHGGFARMHMHQMQGSLGLDCEMNDLVEHGLFRGVVIAGVHHLVDFF